MRQFLTNAISTYVQPPAGLKELKEDAVAKGHDELEGVKTFNRFRVFYMACSELFGMDEGMQYVCALINVGH